VEIGPSLGRLLSESCSYLLVLVLIEGGGAGGGRAAAFPLLPDCVACGAIPRLNDGAAADAGRLGRVPPPSLNAFENRRMMPPIDDPVPNE